MRGPYDYHHPTVDELRPYLGDIWGIFGGGVAADTPANRERYGNCVTPEAYVAAEAKAIEARGWARPCEAVFRALLTIADGRDLPVGSAEWAIREDAREMLKRARVL